MCALIEALDPVFHWPLEDIVWLWAYHQCEPEWVMDSLRRSAKEYGIEPT